MDSSWNAVTTDPTTLNQIAQDLGFSSVDQLPNINNLTGDQVVTLQHKLSSDLMEKFYEASYNYDLPDLDEAEITGDNANMAILLEELNSKLGALYLQFQKENSLSTQDDITRNTADSIKKRDDAFEKQQKAKNANKVSKWLGLAGAIVAVVAAVAVAVVTGGAAIALVAVAIAVVAAVATGLQASGEMDKMLEAAGVDDPKARMWIEIGIQAALMIASICTGVGAGMAVARMGSEIPTMIATISEVTEVSSEAIMAGAKATSVATMIIGALLSIAGGTSGIVGASEGYSATLSQADLLKLQAMLQNLESLMKEIQEEIKKAVKRNQELVWDLPNDILKGVLETNNDIFSTSPA